MSPEGLSEVRHLREESLGRGIVAKRGEHEEL